MEESSRNNATHLKIVQFGRNLAQKYDCLISQLGQKNLTSAQNFKKTKQAILAARRTKWCKS